MSARETPFLAWGDFHAWSRFARSTIPEEKWGTTRSLGIKTMGINEQNHVLHKPVPGSLVTLISVFCFFGGIHLQQIPRLFGFFEFFLSSKICFYTLCFCFPTLIVHLTTKLLGHPPPPPKEKSHENAPIMIMFEIQRLLLLIRVYRYQNVIQYNNNFIIKFITF